MYVCMYAYICIYILRRESLVRTAPVACLVFARDFGLRCCHNVYKSHMVSQLKSNYKSCGVEGRHTPQNTRPAPPVCLTVQVCWSVCVHPLGQKDAVLVSRCCSRCCLVSSCCSSWSACAPRSSDSQHCLTSLRPSSNGLCALRKFVEIKRI